MIENLLKLTAESLLLPLDQITAAVCLLLAFPFAFLLHWAIFASSPNCRFRSFVVNLCTVGPTYLFLWICFYVARGGEDVEGGQKEKFSLFCWDLLSLHLPIVGVFITCKYSEWMRKRPTVLFGLLLLQLAYHHISRQIHFYNQYTVNVTGPLMMLVIKLSAFAYDIHDAKIDMKTVRFGRFMAWNLLFAGFFTGPVVMYREFEGFCENPRKFTSINDDKKASDKTSDKACDKDKTNDNIACDNISCDKACDRVISESESDSKTDSTSLYKTSLAGRKRRATFLILSASLLLIFGLLLQPHFPTQNLLQVVSNARNENSLLYRIVFMHLALLGWRIKYYVAWLLAEGALVIIGLGWIRKDGKIKWYN
jgi:hypothetical protein